MRKNANFVAFTVASRGSEEKLARLMASAKKQEIPLEVRYVPYQGYDRFLDQKHLQIYEVLQGLQKSGVKNFLFLDGWDTVFVAPLPLAMFYTNKLWFGGEKNCYPDESLEPRFSLNGGRFPYLNSGVIWGDIATYLERCPLETGHDQRLWIEEYLSFPEGILIDTYAGVALNLHSTKVGDLSRFPDGVRYNPTGTWPAILHGNGKWPIPQWAGV